MFKISVLKIKTIKMIVLKIGKIDSWILTLTMIISNIGTLGDKDAFCAYSTHLGKGSEVIGSRDKALFLHRMNSKEHTRKPNIEKLNK